MRSTTNLHQRLLALFVLGMVLFSFPMLALFETPRMLGTLPALPLYLFGVWTLLIAGVALVTRQPH